MRHSTLVIVLAVTLCGTVSASDRPYGADGLTYLAQRATLVIRASDPKPIQGDPRRCLIRSSRPKSSRENRPGPP